jgi:hypothetical protein
MTPKMHAGSVAAASLIVMLAMSAVISVWTFRGLYADGGSFFFDILRNADFSHVNPSRISATFITQYPLVAAIKLGVRNIRLLAYIHTASLFAVPLLAYAVSTWVTRRDRILAVINFAFVSSVFYTTSFFIIGEFHVLYGLFWVAFMLLVTGRSDRLAGAGVLPLIGLAISRSYEMSVVISPILCAACVWRTRLSSDPAARAILVLSAYIFAAGVWFGLQGGLFPRDPTQAHLFVGSLSDFGGDAILLEILALFAFVATASALRGLPAVASGIAAALASGAFIWWNLTAHGSLALGNAYEQRAKVVPIILGLSLAAVIRCQFVGARPTTARSPFLLVIIPALAVFALDLHDTFGWRHYIAAFCDTLDDRGSITARGEFPLSPYARAYGWGWMYPSMSLLLRPPGSDAIVTNLQGTDWQPFDPTSQVPDLSRYKGGRAAICAGFTPGGS